MKQMLKIKLPETKIYLIIFSLTLLVSLTQGLTYPFVSINMYIS